jgi:hypothetical protein
MFTATEIAGLPIYMVVVCTLLALIGSSVQGSLGFGLGIRHRRFTSDE